MDGALARDGAKRLPATDQSRAWAAAALRTATPLLAGAERRHGGTWAPGVDLLPNDAAGAVDGVPLCPTQRAALVLGGALHPAQISAVWPGYPGRDGHESEAAHRYRLTRDAAHVDGLLPVGPERRRHAREFHAFVLAIALTPTAMAPTTVWAGSHRIIGPALASAIGPADPREIDITDAYHAARRAAFETCRRVRLEMEPGEAVLLHRHVLHGTSRWSGPSGPPRLIAFFRPEFSDPASWL